MYNRNKSCCHRKTKPDVPPKYNEVDGKVDRRSFSGKYSIEDNGVPRYDS